MRSITISSLQDLDAAAARFLKLTGEHTVFAFSGEMGAGKTTIIQAICRKLGVDVEVNSPTFSLVNEYFSTEGNSIFHIDLYRIESPEELYDMGYEEYFFSGSMCLIEWPERAEKLIPGNALRVKISVLENGARLIQF